MDINPSIFREYDIRGIVGQDLDEAVVRTLGRAIGTYFLGRGKREIVMGRDCRLSSPSFAEALAAGLLATGCNVTDIGIVPTPLMYFGIFFKKLEAGVMITGSHNPPEYNGFKMMAGEETLYGADIQAIRGIITGGKYRRRQGRPKALRPRPGIPGLCAGEHQARPEAQGRRRRRATAPAGSWPSLSSGGSAARSSSSSAIWTGASRTTIPTRPCPRP